MIFIITFLRENIIYLMSFIGVSSMVSFFTDSSLKTPPYIFSMLQLDILSLFTSVLTCLSPRASEARLVLEHSRSTPSSPPFKHTQGKRGRSGHWFT